MSYPELCCTAVKRRQRSHEIENDRVAAEATVGLFEENRTTKRQLCTQFLKTPSVGPAGN